MGYAANPSLHRHPNGVKAIGRPRLQRKQLSDVGNGPSKTPPAVNELSLKWCLQRVLISAQHCPSIAFWVTCLKTPLLQVGQTIATAKSFSLNTNEDLMVHSGTFLPVFPLLSLPLVVRANNLDACKGPFSLCSLWHVSGVSTCMCLGELARNEELLRCCVVHGECSHLKLAPVFSSPAVVV